MAVSVDVKPLMCTHTLRNIQLCRRYPERGSFFLPYSASTSPIRYGRSSIGDLWRRLIFLDDTHGQVLDGREPAIFLKLAKGECDWHVTRPDTQVHQSIGLFIIQPSSNAHHNLKCKPLGLQSSLGIRILNIKFALLPDRYHQTRSSSITSSTIYASEYVFLHHSFL